MISQNLGEAEYVVAVYQYMRLLGYPAERISILATYNGQKHLIRDVLNQRCRDPFFGMPLQVTLTLNTFFKTRFLFLNLYDKAKQSFL